MLVGCATVGIVAVIWGGVHPVPAIHDEAAYILQCKIFATGRWTAHSPPLPAFFEQMWVFVEPAVASKYWPGQSLLMTPGCLVGIPALVPFLLSGVTGALLYLLTVRYTTRSVALLAWALWVTSPPNLRFRATYLANVTTGTLWLIALWSLSRWHSDGRRTWLGAFYLAFGWAAITRPLTAFGLWLPLIVAVTWQARRRPWQSIAPAVAGAAMLLVIPLWSWCTLGTVTTTPYTEYARQYFPFDRPGFLFDESAPRRDLPPEMSRYATRLAGYFAAHTPERLPEIALDRLSVLGTSIFAGWRWMLVPAAAAGLFLALRKRDAVLLAFMSSASLFVAHLVFAHPSEWPHYYLEAFPVPFVLASMGIVAGFRIAAVPRGVCVVLIWLGLSFCAADVLRTWQNERQWRYQVEEPSRLIERLPKPSIVFVTPESHWVSPFGLIQNSTNLASEPVWVVRDRGALNSQLLALAPERSAFLLTLDSMDVARIR